MAVQRKCRFRIVKVPFSQDENGTFVFEANRACLA